MDLATLKQKMDEAHYIYDETLVTVLYVALKLGRPLLIEGAAGVGKTEIAKVMAAALDRELVRLQCYEGLDENFEAVRSFLLPDTALYDVIERSRESISWNNHLTPTFDTLYTAHICRLADNLFVCDLPYDVTLSLYTVEKHYTGTYRLVFAETEDGLPLLAAMETFTTESE